MNPILQLNAFLSRHLTPAVKTIFLINVGFFLGFIVLTSFNRRIAEGVLIFLSEIPGQSVFRFQIWRFLTYAFVHVDGFHLLFNMMILWFFASDLESRWGRTQFWRFYIVTAVGAAVLHAIISLVTGRERGMMIGASGALFGVLFAYAAYYPNRMVLFWGIFPIAIKYLVAIIIAFEILAVGSNGDQISHITHLTGLAVAYAYLTRYHHTSDFTRWRYLR